MSFDCAVIVRSAHERTEHACRKQILDQGVPETQVFVVHEVPFSASMRRSFELGISSGFIWTLCIDADVLLRPGSIQTMLSFADSQQENVCEIQGFVMDKFFGGPRPGGIHLYRTSLLEGVMEKIPKEGVNIRPETHALELMAKEGYPWLNVPYIVGIHDDEQFYRDIFRKAFVQANKHGFILDLFLGIWKREAKKDRDFEIALKGLAAGVQHIGDVYIDISQKMWADALPASDVVEKENLQEGTITLAEVEKRIAGMQSDELYMARFPDLSSFGNLMKASKGSTFQKVKEKWEKLGTLRFVPYVLGAIIMVSGRSVQSFFDKPKSCQ